MSSNLKFQAVENYSEELNKMVNLLLKRQAPEIISRYLKDDINKLNESLPNLVSLLLIKISEKCCVDKNSLLELISFIKDQQFNKNEIPNEKEVDFNAWSKKNDKHADHGTNILTKLFGTKIGEIISEISSQSSLRDESDFTLLAILSSKFIEILKEKYGDEEPETFEVLKTLREFSIKPTDLDTNDLISKNNKTKGSKIVTIPSLNQNPTISKSSFNVYPWLFLLCLLFIVPYLINKDFKAVKFVDYTKDITESQTYIDSKDKIKNYFNLFKIRILNLFESLNFKDNSAIIGDADVSDQKINVLSGKEVMNLSKEKTSIIKPSSRFNVIFDHTAELQGLERGFSEGSLEKKIVGFLLSPIEKEGKFILEGINFLFNKTEIDEVSKKKLQTVGNLLIKSTLEHIDIVGHTDNIGADSANQKISLQRASAAKDELIKAGLDPSITIARGAGSSEPLEENLDSTSRLKNRRLEIIIKKLSNN